MALDEALAESVSRGAPPFLRFYTWDPATLSLGRFQNPDSGLSRNSREVPRVRRTTGGGGIWHADELTYSLGCTQDDLGIKGVKPSFERLCGFLLDAWMTLGWDAVYAKDSPVRPGDLGTYAPACFAGTEEYDILVGGRKLGGNAQKRDRDSIFQHGSLPFVLDHPQLASLFLPGYQPDPQATTDLRSCGWAGTVSDLIAVLAEAFQHRLGVEWQGGSPSSEELSRAKILLQERYADPEWTENGGGSLRNA